MLASTLPENGFQVDSMSDAYASGADEQGASGSAADSDGDSVADETASRGSQSSEAYTITNDVSLMALLSSKTTELTDQKNRVGFQSSSVLDTVPSTSTASTNNYDESDYAIATSDDQRSVTSQKEPFVEEARTTLEQRPPDSISPWMRNAGRKKSHPVWEFFKDLRAPDGTGGVICLHCDWRGDDRSPNNLKTHLKRFHEHDGVYKQFAARLAAVSFDVDSFAKVNCDKRTHRCVKSLY
ncbi:unnamed protein product [Anisakis simplex]|uniref:BED-type domain-containing protein n=1 Tax=Anisakis simplex TaxID=6269 RepID=A0A0M3K4C6_ANISI|nr:unnamed protein product [Anisakis simplex]